MHEEPDASRPGEDGKVQSVGFERNGRRHTVGVIDPGEFHFSTETAERMTIVDGEVFVRVDGAAAWQHERSTLLWACVTTPTGRRFRPMPLAHVGQAE